MTWEVRQDPRDPNAWDVYEGATKIAHLPWCSRINALLITAAPDLLCCLKNLVKAFNLTRILMKEQDTRDLAGQLCQDALAVIAKAEGR